MKRKDAPSNDPDTEPIRPTTRQKLSKARKIPDVLDLLPQYKAYDAGDLHLQLWHYTSKQLPRDLLQWCFELCKANMLQFYQGVWGWSDAKKQKQLKSPASRFVIVFQDSEQKDAVAYINYRLEDDNGMATLYLYELQIEARAQRRGLGQFLMALLEELASVLQLDKLMLTALDSNEAAMKLYTKLGYTVDEDDPSNMDPPERPGYTLLSKRVSVPVQAQ